jgi:hypothetical protein
MPESEDERNRAIVDAMRLTLAEAVGRLAPDIEPALHYSPVAGSELAEESADDQ